MIKTILVLILEISWCVCPRVFQQPPGVGVDSSWRALGQMLNACVGLGAPWGRVKGGVFTYIYIYMYTYTYTYAHVCMLAA